MTCRQTIEVHSTGAMALCYSITGTPATFQIPAALVQFIDLHDMLAQGWDVRDYRADEQADAREARAALVLEGMKWDKI